MITTLLSSPIAQALAWTILHSIWQIAIIALALVIVLRLMRYSTAAARYMVSLAAMSIVVLTSLVTLGVMLIEEPSQAAVALEGPQLLPAISASGNASLLATILQSLDGYTDYIVSIWMIGAMLLLLRIVFGYTYLLQIVRHATLEDRAVIKKLAKLRKRFDISREVSIKCSAHIKTTMVMGLSLIHI